MSIERARELRNNATVPERVMWRLLKMFREQGFHFRRQVPIGKYYADFICHKEKLIIEVDGDTHGVDNALVHDEIRTQFLRSRGFRVIRFTNSDVIKNPEGVFFEIEQVLK